MIDEPTFLECVRKATPATLRRRNPRQLWLVLQPQHVDPLLSHIGRLTAKMPSLRSRDAAAYYGRLYYEDVISTLPEHGRLHPLEEDFLTTWRLNAFPLPSRAKLQR
jgi:hypothetical protein